MKARKLMALLLAALFLFGTVPSSATTAAGTGRDGSTADWCAYSADGKHNWTEWWILEEATCSAEGKRMRVCLNDCGVDPVETIPKLAHTWSDWKVTREATCTAEGSRTRVCSVCGERQTEAIAKIAHTWGNWQVTKEATCSAEGSRTHVCSVCGEKQTEAVPTVAHQWGAWETTLEATDHSAGVRTRTCAVCGATATETFDPEGTLRRGDAGEAVRAMQEGLICYGVLKAGGADGSFGPGTEQAVAAVQAAEGFAEDGVAWPQTQAVLGHQWSDWETVSEMTDWSIGVKRRVCARCGATEEETSVPSPIYRRGDQGEGVKALQAALNAAGYDCGVADGDFGAKTESAVKALETAHGVPADGVAWPGVLKLLGLIEDLQTAIAQPGVEDFGTGGFGVNPMKLGSRVMPVLGLRVTPGAVRMNGEDIHFSFTVTNVSDTPVNLSMIYSVGEYQSDKVPPVYYLEKDGNMVRLTEAEDLSFHTSLFDANERLEPGESVRMELHTQPTESEHYMFAAVKRHLYVIADPVRQAVFGEDEPLPPPICGTAILYCPVSPTSGQLALLTQGNVTRTGSGAEEVVTVEMRLENLSDSPLDVEISEEGHEPFDPQYMWTSLDWTSFTLEGRGVREFTVSMKPTEDEIDSWYLWRHVNAYVTNVSSQYGLTQLLNIPLSVYPYGQLDISGGEEALEDNVFSVPLTATLFPLVQTEYTHTPNAEDVRLVGGLYGPDGSCLDFFEIAPNPDSLEPGQSTTVNLRYIFTEEQIALGEATFIIWAEYHDNYDGDKAASYSWNEYRRTIDLSGASAPGGSGPFSVAASVREGDRRFRVGDPLTLDVEVAYTGKNPIYYLNVNAEGWYDSYFASTTPIPEFTGLTLAEGSASQLAPQTWHFTQELTVPASAVSEGVFSIMAFATAVDAVTQELYADDVTLNIQCVTEGLDLYAVPDTEFFTPGEPVHIEVTVENTDTKDFESLLCVARYDSPAVDKKSPHTTLIAEHDFTFTPGQTKTKTFTYIPTEEDAANGSIQVYIYADASYPGTYSSDLVARRSVFFFPGPKAKVSLSAERNVVVFDPGTEEEPAPVPVYLTVANTGETALTDFALHVDIETPLGVGSRDSDVALDKPLEPGESVSVPYEFLSTGHEAGRIGLAFTISAKDPVSGVQAHATEDVALVQRSVSFGDLSLECALAGENGYYPVGGEAILLLTVRNTGDAPLGETTLSVGKVPPKGVVASPYLIDSWESIEGGGERSATYAYTVTIEDYFAGRAVLAFIASSEPTEESPDGDGAMAVFQVVTEPFDPSEDTQFFLPVVIPDDAPAADIQLTKQVIGEPTYPEGYHLGEYINYQISVTNSAAEAVSGLTVYDVCSGAEGAEAAGTLALGPGETRSLSYFHRVTADDVAAGHVDNYAQAQLFHYEGADEGLVNGPTFLSNTVTVSTTDLQPPTPDLPDEYWVGITKQEYSKPEHEEGYLLGETVWYAITVHNPTANDIGYIWVYDEVSGYEDQPEYVGCVSLAPDQSVTLYWPHVVTEMDVSLGQVEDQASALIDVIDENQDVQPLRFYSDYVFTPVCQTTPRDTPRPDDPTPTRDPGTIIFPPSMNPTPRPTTEPPVTEPPVSEPPTTGEPPITEPPVTRQPPATEPPTTEEPPVTEPPVTRQPPVTEPPTTGEPPVTEPPATEPPSLPAEGDCCKRVLIALGTGAYDYELSACAAHQHALDACAALLSGAASPQDVEATVALLTDEVNAEYESMLAGLSGDAAALLVSERETFFEQLGASQAMLADIAGESDAAQLTATRLLERLIDLCYERHTAPAARLDSRLSGEYLALSEEEAPALCGRDLTPTGRTLLCGERACAQHAPIEGALAGGLSAAALEQARLSWEAARQTLFIALYPTADADLRAKITADLFGFSAWAEARGALLEALYPDELTAAEVLSAAVRARVLETEALFANP